MAIHPGFKIHGGTKVRGLEELAGRMVGDPSRPVLGDARGKGPAENGTRVECTPNGIPLRVVRKQVQETFDIFEGPEQQIDEALGKKKVPEKVTAPHQLNYVASVLMHHEQQIGHYNSMIRHHANERDRATSLDEKNFHSKMTDHHTSIGGDHFAKAKKLIGLVHPYAHAALDHELASRGSKMRTADLKAS